MLVFFSILIGHYPLAQSIINYEEAVEGMIELSEDISIPKVKRGYTAWIPDKKPVKGLIVFTHSRRDTVNSDTFIRYALGQQLAVLYATTENRLEFFFEPEKMAEIENYIYEVTVSQEIPLENIFYCGMSLEGTRALKLASYGQSESSIHCIQPKAIVICDSPLDMLRFHRAMSKAEQLDFHPAAANEGKWVSAYLESKLGGSPDEKRQAYVDYSPYCYSADGGPNLRAFLNIAIRAYTEPDVTWWMKTRRKDYYSMNSLDLAALINDLNILGNQQAELIITQNKGYLPDGRRHPHSWSIVDEMEMIDWFASLIIEED